MNIYTDFYYSGCFETGGDIIQSIQAYRHAMNT